VRIIFVLDFTVDFTYNFLELITIPIIKENVMASTVDEITINYKEDDLLIVKELDKEILSKGAWATIMFRYQQLDRKTKEYGNELYTIRRYQKRGDSYNQKSKFNISSKDQAGKIVATLQKWMQESK